MPLIKNQDLHYEKRKAILTRGKSRVLKAASNFIHKEFTHVTCYKKRWIIIIPRKKQHNAPKNYAKLNFTRTCIWWYAQHELTLKHSKKLAWTKSLEKNCVQGKRQRSNDSYAVSGLVYTIIDERQTFKIADARKDKLMPNLTEISIHFHHTERRKNMLSLHQEPISEAEYKSTSVEKPRNAQKTTVQLSEGRNHKASKNC